MASPLPRTPIGAASAEGASVRARLGLSWAIGELIYGAVSPTGQQATRELFRWPSGLLSATGCWAATSVRTPVRGIGRLSGFPNGGRDSAWTQSWLTQISVMPCSFRHGTLLTSTGRARSNAWDAYRLPAML